MFCNCFVYQLQESVVFIFEHHCKQGTSDHSTMFSNILEIHKNKIQRLNNVFCYHRSWFDLQILRSVSVGVLTVVSPYCKITQTGCDNN